MAHRFTSEEARAAGRKGGLKLAARPGYMAAIGRNGGKAAAGRRKPPAAANGLTPAVLEALKPGVNPKLVDWMETGEIRVTVNPDFGGMTEDDLREAERWDHTQFVEAIKTPAAPPPAPAACTGFMCGCDQCQRRADEEDAAEQQALHETDA